MGSPDTVIVQVGTNDLKNRKNVDLIMGEAYELVAMVKKNFRTAD